MKPEPRKRLSLPSRGREIILPEDVTTADWGYERRSWQNPRIRGLLKNLRLLEQISESSSSVMHCSIRRLFDVMTRLRTISQSLQVDLAPYLEEASKIPALEDARFSAVVGLKSLTKNVLTRLDDQVAQVAEAEVAQLRRFLSKTLDEVTAYVQHTLSRFVACDPRSQFDVDYFVSKKFSKDIDNAEWLYSTVCALEEHVKEFDRIRQPALVRCAENIRASRRVPTPEQWKLTGHVLEQFRGTLVPMLRAVAAVPGTRLEDLELLDNLTVQIWGQTTVLNELYSLAQELEEILQSPPPSSQSDDDASPSATAVVGRRLANLLMALEQHIQELAGFVAGWRKGISHRRALLLSRDDHLDE